MFFLVYRGVEGLMAVLSPVLIGLPLHFIMVKLIYDHDFEVLMHLWSLGLSLICGGLITAYALHRKYNLFLINNNQNQTPTPVATEESTIQDQDEGLPASQPTTNSPTQQQSVPHANQFPVTPDGLWRLASEPVGTHHVCFVAPNQVAVIYVALGLLLLLIDVMNTVLAPIGGFFGAILWIILLGVAYFLKVMVFSDSPLAAETELPMTEMDAHDNNNNNKNNNHEEDPQIQKNNDSNGSEIL